MPTHTEKESSDVDFLELDNYLENFPENYPLP